MVISRRGQRSIRPRHEPLSPRCRRIFLPRPTCSAFGMSGN